MTKEEALEKIEELKKFVYGCDGAGYENDEIFLLSEKEYLTYADSIPPISAWWWLRSPVKGDRYVSGVRQNGCLDFHFVDFKSGCVRPALKLNNPKRYDTNGIEVGERIFIYEFPWIVIGERMAIAEVPIGFEKYDSDSNDYYGSHIRKFILEWKSKRFDWGEHNE